MTTQECEHLKRMLINNVLFCLVCQEYLYSGVCPRCRRAYDDHNLADLAAPVCPKDVPA